MRFYRVLHLLPALALCVSCKQTRTHFGFGDDWRSMSQLEKEAFVQGYLDGNGLGTVHLCNALEDQLDGLKFKQNVPPADSTCPHFAPAYTHGDRNAFATPRYADPYVSVLNDFYEHRECRMMPYTVVMSHLNDAEYKSGEELFQFVRSGSAQWGFFSGFDDIEKCYGADRRR